MTARFDRRDLLRMGAGGTAVVGAAASLPLLLPRSGAASETTGHAGMAMQEGDLPMEGHGGPSMTVGDVDTCLLYTSPSPRDS